MTPRKRKRQGQKGQTDKADNYTETTFTCPACDEPLKAREWKGETAYQHRIEVLSLNGFILIKTSGALKNVFLLYFSA
jgi:transcription initiation factor IIE alpha subunit